MTSKLKTMIATLGLAAALATSGMAMAQEDGAAAAPKAQVHKAKKHRGHKKSRHAKASRHSKKRMARAKKRARRQKHA